MPRLPRSMGRRRDVLGGSNNFLFPLSEIVKPGETSRLIAKELGSYELANLPHTGMQE